MRGRRLLFFHLIIILFGRSAASTSQCDMSSTARVHEGNLGQTSDFNWLGVLKVHLHDGDTVQVAVSGIVLIKLRYAIANADDVVRIPTYVFEQDTKMMFLAAEDTTWAVPPVSYVTHPEYEYSTFNSIAIIELNIDAAENFPLNPICFPRGSYNTSQYLYLTGYTDENKLLEKVIYKIQYLPKDACEEFYDRAGLTDKNRVPSSYICGYAPYNGTHCVWDNGMALVSNVTGWFTLIGFGVRGPGCLAPSRFIDMQTYLPWIESVTTAEEEIYDYRRQDSIEFVPAHELFTMNSTRRDKSDSSGSKTFTRNINHEYERYPFNVKKLKNFNIEAVDGKVIAIFPFNQTLEMYVKSCSSMKTLMYRENFEIKTRQGNTGTALYKLSMFDLMTKVCVCVELTIECKNRSEATLSFKEEIDFSLGTQLTESGETPEELFRYYPVNEITAPTTPSNELWKPGKNLAPKFVKDTTKMGSVLSYDLYIKFEFIERAVLNFEMFAKPPPFTSTPRSATTLPTVTKKSLRHGHLWGMRVPIDRRVKEPVVTLVAEHEVVQETVSRGCCNETFIVVFVVGYFVISFCFEIFL